MCSLRTRGGTGMSPWVSAAIRQPPAKTTGATVRGEDPFRRPMTDSWTFPFFQPTTPTPTMRPGSSRDRPLPHQPDPPRSGNFLRFLRRHREVLTYGRDWIKTLTSGVGPEGDSPGIGCAKIITRRRTGAPEWEVNVEIEMYTECY